MTVDDGGLTPGTVLQSRYPIVGLIGRDPARLERFLSEVRSRAMIIAVAGWVFYKSLGGRSAFGAAFD